MDTSDTCSRDYMQDLNLYINNLNISPEEVKELKIKIGKVNSALFLNGVKMGYTTVYQHALDNILGIPSSYVKLESLYFENIKEKTKELLHKDSKPDESYGLLKEEVEEVIKEEVKKGIIKEEVEKIEEKVKKKVENVKKGVIKEEVEEVKKGVIKEKVEKVKKGVIKEKVEKVKKGVIKEKVEEVKKKVKENAKEVKEEVEEVKKKAEEENPVPLKLNEDEWPDLNSARTITYKDLKKNKGYGGKSMKTQRELWNRYSRCESNKQRRWKVINSDDISISHTFSYSR